MVRLLANECRRSCHRRRRRLALRDELVRFAARDPARASATLRSLPRENLAFL